MAVAIAIPSTCIGTQTCTSLQQCSTVLHEIARAAILFDVKEIIVYDVPPSSQPGEKSQKRRLDEPAPVAKTSWESIACSNILQLIVTPRYLRKQLFGSPPLYKYVRKLPPPPGLPSTDLVQGIAIKKHTAKRRHQKKTKKEKTDERLTPFVNLGFDTVFRLDEEVPVKSNVWIDVKTRKSVPEGPSLYSVRAVPKFSAIFTQAPVEYTSTLWCPSQEFFSKSDPLLSETSARSENLLLVFGRWQEVEAAVGNDPDLGVGASELFDGKFPTPRKARLEDSVMISLAKLG